MRGSYFNYLAAAGDTLSAVEKATALHKEQCELRLARIANGAEPRMRNGAPAMPNKRTPKSASSPGTKR